MISTNELAMYIRDVKYKPGWAFRIYDGRYEGQHLVIQTQVIDAYNPEEIVTLDVHSMLPPMENRKQFMDWLQWRLIRIECHESREFFRVDGVCWSDPHADGADQDI